MRPRVRTRYAGTDHPLAKVNRSELGSYQRLGLDAEDDVTQLEDLSDELAASPSALG